MSAGVGIEFFKRYLIPCPTLPSVFIHRLCFTFSAIANMLSRVLFLISFVISVLALNFDYENVQLTEVETSDYPSIRFGDVGNSPPIKECRVIPGDNDWPSDAEWAQFNKTLGGVLLKPIPLAAPCYEGPSYDAARCDQLKKTWSNIGMQ
jgi:hypothetical protein